MHIPDGYLSPVFSLSTGVVTVPAWAIASRKVGKVLNNRTVPLLAIFAALSFTIMMFNVPVPGGTTAHGVGATLVAIVLGPWAAAIVVSTALIIQALFFGDGGVLAIFPNCLNMGIIMPFVGYYLYKLLAGGSPLLSQRRVWSAAIASYVAITIAALAVGFELGLQPILFTQNGQPLYSPYALDQALLAMLLAHTFGASIVEALITGLGLAYIQKRHPEFLTSLKQEVSGRDVPEGVSARWPLWQVISIGVGVALVLLVVAGLATGGWDFGHFFGADWSQVDWASVATMLLLVAVVAAVLIPLSWFLLPKRLRGVFTAFVAASIVAPLGLIAPGFAYGEGSAEDVQAAFGYIPQGFQQFSDLFSAPFGGYNLPLPFFSDANAALWQAAIGYEISGILGIFILALFVLGLVSLIQIIRTSATEEREARIAQSPPTSVEAHISPEASTS